MSWIIAGCNLFLLWWYAVQLKILVGPFIPGSPEGAGASVSSVGLEQLFNIPSPAVSTTYTVSCSVIYWQDKLWSCPSDLEPEAGWCGEVVLWILCPESQGSQTFLGQQWQALVSICNLPSYCIGLISKVIQYSFRYLR